MLIVVENGPGNQFPNLDEAVYISHIANTFAKAMNPAIFRLAIDKLLETQSSLVSVWQPV